MLAGKDRRKKDAFRIISPVKEQRMVDHNKRTTGSWVEVSFQILSPLKSIFENSHNQDNISKHRSHSKMTSPQK